MSSRIRLLLAPLALTLALGACSGDDGTDVETGDGGAAASTTEAAKAAGASTTAKAAGGAAAATTAAGTLSRPKIEAKTGTPPTQLQTNDLVVGSGAEAKAGQKVTVQYVGALFETGKEFDASWNRGEPFSFNLGGGQVIKGWDQGVAGMKVGGRRELVIPPDLAYGSRGAGGVIPPNATLVFVVDLVAVG